MWRKKELFGSDYASDIQEVKDYIKAKGKSTRVVAKIEKPEAIKEIDKIIEKPVPVEVIKDVVIVDEKKVKELE